MLNFFIIPDSPFHIFVFAMLKDFRYYLSRIEKNPAGKQFLLAISGGLDSVVLTELFRLSGYKFSIAHCNFQLRGKESDEDLNFVKKLAGKTQTPFFSVNFETERYCKENKLSVQMGARQLRYKWLEETRQKNKLNYIVTAHHADDAIETFFINLLRGTGISGLHGIREKNENVIRPMLHFYRKDIENFAKENKLKWREDSSNEGDKYERNRIRHHLIPALEEVNKDAKKQVISTMEMLASTGEIYKENIEKMTSEFVKRNKSKTTISFKLLEKPNYSVLYLYEIIKEFGFNYSQAVMIDDTIKKAEPGSIFHSDSHRIFVDRKHLFTLPYYPSKPGQFVVSKGISMIRLNGSFCWFEKIKKTEKFKPETSSQMASLDYNKLSFPLVVRKWENGDRFYPLGMKQSKKVSDFLIDNKVSRADKEHVYVLVSGGKIVWLMGFRIDEKYKVSKETKNVYLCSLIEKNTP